jgi:hypothetical protein
MFSWSIEHSNCKYTPEEMQRVIDAPTAITSAVVANIHEITSFDTRGDEKGTCPIVNYFLEPILEAFGYQCWRNCDVL